MSNPNNQPFIWNDPEYLKLRNAALQQMQVSVESVNQQLANLDPKSKEAGALRKEAAAARRSIRALGSEPYAIFGKELEQGLSSGNALKPIGAAEAAQRKDWQAVPGLHGHHQFPINSTWDPSSKMDLGQQVEGLKILTDRGYHLGNRGDKFLWLSGPAHVEGWPGRNDVFAHQAESGVGSDTKRFTINTLPSGTSGAEYADLVEPKIKEQLRINQQSLSQPNEIQVRNAIDQWAQRLGIQQVFGLEELDKVKANNKLFKDAGFNATSYARDIGQYDWASRRMPKGSLKALGLLGIAAAGIGANSPAEAAVNIAEAATGADQLYGTNQRNVQMVNVNGKLRPFDPETNTLIDSPNKGLQRKNGKWVEVVRGQGAASRQQATVQADQLFAKPKPVMANTPTGVAKLKAMPRSKSFNLGNELNFFVIKPFNDIINKVTRKDV